MHDLGNQLFEAYLIEQQKSQTWETKVEMILALGLIDFKPALPEIKLVTSANKSFDMITIAAAKTYVRLSRIDLTDAQPTIQLLDGGGLSVVKGALIPIGADKMMPPKDEVEQLIKLSWDLHRHKDRIGKERSLLNPRYGLALGCAGWEKQLTAEFLYHCIATSAEDKTLKQVAELALKGKYGKSR